MSRKHVQRCGARTRKGTLCLRPAIKNPRTGRKVRCRNHGGLSTGPKRETATPAEVLEAVQREAESMGISATPGEPNTGARATRHGLQTSEGQRRRSPLSDQAVATIVALAFDVPPTRGDAA